MTRRQIGSDAHRDLFCRAFVESHESYEAEDLSWPSLASSQLDLLRRLPLWSQALYDERSASLLLYDLARTTDDLQVKEAIEVQALEEARHAAIVGHLVDLCDIDPGVVPAYTTPPDVIGSAISFGYCECTDGFMANGFLGTARTANILPEPLLAIFDRVLDEEARHNVFFLNWVAWLKRDSWIGAGPMTAVAGYASALRSRIAAVSEISTEDTGYTPVSLRTILPSFRLGDFLSTCISESERRLSRVDASLIRPRLPSVATRAVLPLVRSIL